MTFTEFGAAVGLVTGIFTLLDRLILGRPFSSISVGEPVGGARTLDLRCQNGSKLEAFIIKQIRLYPPRLILASENTRRGIIEAAIGRTFGATLTPGEERKFPIMVKSALLDEGTDWVPFVIIVSWRKSRSMWLPQIPMFVFFLRKEPEAAESSKMSGLSYLGIYRLDRWTGSVTWCRPTGLPGLTSPTSA